MFGYAPRNGPSSHPNVLAIPPSHGRYRYAGMFCINSGVGVAADVFASSVINIYSNTHCSVFVSLVTAIMYVQVFSDVCLVCSQVRVAPGMLSPVLIGRFVFFCLLVCNYSRAFWPSARQAIVWATPNWPRLSWLPPICGFPDVGLWKSLKNPDLRFVARRFKYVAPVNLSIWQPGNP